MQNLKRSLEQVFEHSRPYDAKHHPGKIKLKMYMGPIIDENGRVTQSEGYYKAEHLVYAVKPDALSAMIKGEYYIDALEIDHIHKIMGLSSHSRDDFMAEVTARSTQSSKVGAEEEPPEKQQEIEADEAVAKPVVDGDSEPNTGNLIRLLAFYRKEVHICTVHPRSARGGDKATPGDTPSPAFNDVLASVKSNGSIDVDNVWFVPNNGIPNRLILGTVPRGGGQKVNDSRRLRL
jgi:hypothetical protein